MSFKVKESNRSNVRKSTKSTTTIAEYIVRNLGSKNFLITSDSSCKVNCIVEGFTFKEILQYYKDAHTNKVVHHTLLEVDDLVKKQPLRLNEILKNYFSYLTVPVDKKMFHQDSFPFIYGGVRYNFTIIKDGEKRELPLDEVKSKDGYIPEILNDWTILYNMKVKQPTNPISGLQGFVFVTDCATISTYFDLSKHIRMSDLAYIIREDNTVMNDANFTHVVELDRRPDSHKLSYARDIAKGCLDGKYVAKSSYSCLQCRYCSVQCKEKKIYSQCRVNMIANKINDHTMLSPKGKVTSLGCSCFSQVEELEVSTNCKNCKYHNTVSCDDKMQTLSELLEVN